MDHLQRLLYSLLPGTCILCDAASGPVDICGACTRDLPWLRNACLYCSLPVKSPTTVCQNCATTRPPYSAALCGFEYAFPVDVLIHRFKDQLHLASGEVLSRLTLSRIAPLLSSRHPDDIVVVPVPLHPGKRRKRGFNQSELIASVLARGLGFTLEHLVSRVRQTSDQKSLSRVARRANLAGAFKITRSPRQRVVLLVDDVITTGTTITSISRMLLQHGAPDVIVAAIARTPTAPRSDGVVKCFF